MTWGLELDEPSLVVVGLRPSVRAVDFLLGHAINFAIRSWTRVTNVNT